MVFCCCFDGNLSYCLSLSVPFFLRPHADVPSVLKCSCNNPYMRLGETLAADIILSVTDKHGNKTGKVSVWNLKLFFYFLFPMLCCMVRWKHFDCKFVNNHLNYFECHVSSSEKKTWQNQYTCIYNMTDFCSCWRDLCIEF